MYSHIALGYEITFPFSDTFRGTRIFNNLILRMLQCSEKAGEAYRTILLPFSFQPTVDFFQLIDYSLCSEFSNIRSFSGTPV